MLLTLSLGVALAAAVAGPDLGRIGRDVLGYYNFDQAGALYINDAVHRALRAGRLPLRDPLEFYPFGSPLLSADGNGLETLVSGLFRLVFPWPTWYALGQLAWIPLNLLAFLPLGLYLWRRTSAALAVGAAWAILPCYIEQIAAGRTTQVVLAGVPLAVLGLLHISEHTPSRGQIALAGAGLAFAGIGYWFYALFLVLCLPFFVAHGLRHRPARALLVDLAKAGALAFALALPFALPVVAPTLTGGWAASPPLSASRMSPVFDNALRIVGPQPRQLHAWFPWVLLPGLLWTAWRGPRRWLWLGAAAFCLTCALGPATQIGQTVWHLPYEILWRTVPYLIRLTHPDRWVEVGGLFLVLAAASALAHSAPPFAWLLPAGVLAQLYLAGNLPMGGFNLQPPPVWQYVARHGRGALIVVPVLQAPETCRWQIFHRRPTLGGRSEAVPWAWSPQFRRFVSSNALLMQLYGLGRGRDGPIAVYQQDLDALYSVGFTTVVFDGESWQHLPDVGDIPVVDRLTAAFGPPVFQERTGAVWDLPSHGLSGSPPKLAIRLPEP